MTGPALMSAALMSATLLAAAGRPWGAPQLAWLALTPAFHAVSVAPGRPLRAGAATYLAAIGLVGVAYEAALGLSLVAYPLTVLAAAVPFGAAGAASAWVAGRLPAVPPWLTLPLLWCAAEVLVRQEWLLGRWVMPFSAIGYTQSGTAAVHLARFSSVTAVSLAVLLVNGLVVAVLTAVGRHLRRPGRSPAAPGGLRSCALAVAGLAAVFAAVTAAWRTAPVVAASRSPLDPSVARISVLQPNLPAIARGAARLDPSVAAELAAGLGALAGALEPGPGRHIQVWPEAVWPGLLGGGTEAAASDHLQGVPPALIGAVSRHAVTGATSNAAFLWSGGALNHVFDKRHTVPLAEDGLVRSSAPAVVIGGGVAVAPLICYDVAFPATVRQAARGGAELLAVLTDDTFAAGSDVPFQHLRVAQLRAVESGLWLAFASNGGPSALIDPAGQVVAVTEPGEATLLTASARLGTGSTPYLEYGDWVGALTWLLSAALVSLAGLKGGGYGLPRTT